MYLSEGNAVPADESMSRFQVFREFGLDPDETSPRDAETVEGYEQ